MRGRWPGRIAVVALAIAALSACEDGTPVQRGFGSHQILNLRDPTFIFYGRKGDLVFYETGYGTSTTTYWSIDVQTGEVHDLGTMPPDLTSHSPPPAFRCEYETDQNGLTGNFVITNTMSGETTVIDRVYTALSSCPTATDPTFEVWRKESDDTVTFWTGPYTDLHQVPLAVVVHQVLWKVPATTLVTAPAPGTTDGLGVFAIPDEDPTTATEIIPAALGPAAWAAGASPSTALASAGLAEPSFFLSSGIGHYAYMRVMDDGSRVMFVGPQATETARELALFPIGPDSNMSFLQIEPYNFRFDHSWPLTPAWSTVEGNPPTSTFRVWREASARLATCAWPADQYPYAIGDPANENTLFLVQRTNGLQLSDPSPLLLMVPNASDGNVCRIVAPNNVGFADFSPDGTAMVWLDEPRDEKATLWTAGRDGSAPRAIGTGDIAGAIYAPVDQPHFVGDSQLELVLDTDLVWVDVHDDPVRTHYITERAFGPTLDMGRWVVTGHDYSDQDATGRLALINRDSGETRPISPAVSYYVPLDLPYGFRDLQDDGRPHRIVYLVRGRNPSAQDGLWVATITPQDRQ
ncbi:MAG TPA: hypothetical protein VIQ54_31840 [Polyangia bacterium]